MNKTSDKKTLILLVGPSASGKTHLQSYLRKQGLSIVVSTTTRNSRPGEVQGFDYQFIDEYTSKQHELNNEFVELVVYNDVRYGVVLPELEKKFIEGNGTAILIVEPTGINRYISFCKLHDITPITVYIETPPAVRFERLKQQAYISSGYDYEYYSGAGVDRIIRSAIHEFNWQYMHDWDWILNGENTAEESYECLKEKGIL